jgi:hypothetical protein
MASKELLCNKTDNSIYVCNNSSESLPQKLEIKDEKDEEKKMYRRNDENFFVK